MATLVAFSASVGYCFMQEWSALSVEDRAIIEDRILTELGEVGIKGAVTRWIKPSHLRPWQLVIQTSWCSDKPASNVDVALDQAMARADVQAPKNVVMLMGPTHR